MPGYAQLVLGPAGCGKSTYSARIEEHAHAKRRQLHVVNLDPAAENFFYNVAIDVRDLISVDEVMGEMHLGPNGALVFCMEYLVQNFDWLKDQLDQYIEDSYFVFDCPGQIELYSHGIVMKQLAETLQQWGFRVCSIYLVDAMFVSEVSKYISAALAAMSCMLQLELPHINVITKCDLVDSDSYEKLLIPGSQLMYELNKVTSPAFQNLNGANCSLLDDFSMVQFIPHDPTDEESLDLILLQVDNAIQWGEDNEPNPKDYNFGDEETDEGD